MGPVTCHIVYNHGIAPPDPLRPPQVGPGPSSPRAAGAVTRRRGDAAEAAPVVQSTLPAPAAPAAPAVPAAPASRNRDDRRRTVRSVSVQLSVSAGPGPGTGRLASKSASRSVSLFSFFCTSFGCYPATGAGSSINSRGMAAMGATAIEIHLVAAPLAGLCSRLADVRVL